MFTEMTKRAVAIPLQVPYFKKDSRRPKPRSAKTAIIVYSIKNCEPTVFDPLVGAEFVIPSLRMEPSKPQANRRPICNKIAKTPKTLAFAGDVADIQIELKFDII